MRTIRKTLFVTERSRVSVELSLFRSFCGADVRASDDSGLTFWVGLPWLVSLWVTLSTPALRRFCSRYDWHELGFRVHNWTLWVSLWCDESCSGGRVSFWHRHRRRFNVGVDDVARLLFGKRIHETREVQRIDAIVPMPEHPYPAVLVEEEIRTGWARLPWRRSRRRWGIEIDGGIPVPGKGENSWDCGDDATFGMWGPFKTGEQAIGAVVESVLRTRRRYGGRGWLPPSLRATP